MSALLINIRVLHWHLQINERYEVSLIRNEYHIRTNYKDGLFQIYKFEMPRSKSTCNEV